MPRGDRTGPFGLGPRTGRGLCYCAGFDAPGFTQPAYGRGMARGGCFGWLQRAYAPRSSWGTPRYALPTKADTLQPLRSEADWLKSRLDAIQQRIEELEKESTA